MTVVGIFLNNEMRTGANRRYLELMEGLAQLGNDVFVIMNARLEYAPKAFKRIDLDVKYRRKGFPPASYLFARAIKRSMGQVLAAIGDKASPGKCWIHIHGDMHLRSATVLKKRLRASLFFAFRCNDVKRAHLLRESGHLNPVETAMSFVHESLNRLRERQVASRAELVTFQNASDRDEFLARTRYPAGKTVIIPGNIGMPRFSDDDRDKNASVRLRRLIYVGTLSVSKGLQYVLEAFAELVKRGHKDLSLTVLGKINGDEPAFRLAAELGIREKVRFEGFRLPFPYFAETDLMVYPTLYDAFPDTILEALHVGCPVMASSVGGIPDLLSHEELLFAASDVRDIADKIERCVNDDSYYMKIKALCAARAESFRFDWPKKFDECMKGF